MFKFKKKASNQVTCDVKFTFNFSFTFVVVCIKKDYNNMFDCI